MDPVVKESAKSQNLIEEKLPPARGVFLKTIAPGLLMLGGVFAVGGIARLLQSLLHQDADTVLRMTLAVGAISLGVTMALTHRRQWVLPSVQMRTLIHEIRVGRAPIEEFSKFRAGSLGELSAEVKSLLHDLRQQRQAVLDLQDEVRQRIAHRETVLERGMTALRNQVVRDSLTGLYNRRMFDQLLPQLISQCQTDHKPLTLLMMDVDHFKKLNDTLGHAIGDEMLKSVGQIIQSTIREGDFGCRYGGDEFVVILPGCEIAASKRVSDRLESLVYSLSVTYKIPNRPRLSIGACCVDELKEPNAANLLKIADERLYKIKQARRAPATGKTAAA
jgi:two-component system, cell cycle response regulator